MPDPATTTLNLAMEQENISFNTTVSKEADFQVKCKACVLHSDEDVHIAFDTPANTGSFFLKADEMLTIGPPCEFTKISALGNSTTGTLYIIGRR